MSANRVSLIAAAAVMLWVSSARAQSIEPLGWTRAGEAVFKVSASEVVDWFDSDPFFMACKPIRASRSGSFGKHKKRCRMWSEEAGCKLESCEPLESSERSPDRRIAVTVKTTRAGKKFKTRVKLGRTAIDYLGDIQPDEVNAYFRPDSGAVVIVVMAAESYPAHAAAVITLPRKR